MASVVPVRAAIMSAVSPYSVSGVFGSAPALMSRTIIAALPLVGRQLHRRHAFAVCGRCAGARANQQVRHLPVVGAHGPVKRRGAVDLRER